MNGYQLAGCDSHVLDTSPWQRDAVQYLTRFPSVDTETVLCGTKQTLAFWMEINRSAREHQLYLTEFGHIIWRLWNTIEHQILTDAKCHSISPDSAGFRIGIGDQSEIFQVPEKNAPVRSAGGQQELVRMEYHLIDGCRVFPQLWQQPSGSNVPHLQIIIANHLSIFTFHSNVDCNTQFSLHWWISKYFYWMRHNEI